MSILPKSIEKVIASFERLPGVGPKSAARMVYHFLRSPKNNTKELAEALLEMKESIVTCSSCFNVADSDPCEICSDKQRELNELCVVEEPLDVVAIEKAGIFRGRYFVLGGVISPADGIDPEHLRMADLKRKIQSMTDEFNGEKTLEVIIATNPSLEGEATASYIRDMIKGIKAMNQDSVEISRLAMGLPTGADLEYADRLTLKRALEGRTKI